MSPRRSTTYPGRFKVVRHVREAFSCRAGDLDPVGLGRRHGGGAGAARRRLEADVMASDVLHGDDTLVPVLAPGAGKTRTGRLWTYVRDESPHGGDRPPAALFFYSPDRQGERPVAHLKAFTGILHADGYAGFNGLYDPRRQPGPSSRRPARRM
jgi:hypothetical protein